MKRAVLAIALVAGFFVGGAIAQPPPDDQEAIPPRSIQLTAEQDHVIKEIVLKDTYIEQVPRSTEIRIGSKVPPNIELQNFPPLVAEKVPQVRTYKFFITENQIVVVSPQNIIADIVVIRVGNWLARYDGCSAIECLGAPMILDAQHVRAANNLKTAKALGLDIPLTSRRAPMS